MIQVSQTSRLLGLRRHVLTADTRDVRQLARLVREGREGTWTKLADIAELSPTTASRFARGKTRRPHFRTVVRLLTALGYDVTYGTNR